MNTTDERLKNLPIQRVKNILLSPTTEWPVIAAETTTPKELYLKYVMLLAAIPAVGMFIGMAVVGVITLPHLGTYRLDFGTGIAHAILHYAMSLGLVWVVALIIDGLAPKFGSEKNFNQSLKLVAYAMTPGWIAGILNIRGFVGFGIVFGHEMCPGWIAGILNILPSLGLLAVLASLYGVYLLYIGLAPMKNTPAKKQASYFGVSLVCTILAVIIMAEVLVPFRPAQPKAQPRMTLSEAKALQDAVMKQFEKTGDIPNKKLEEAGKTK